MQPKIVILSAFLSPYRSGAKACVEEIAVRLCDRYDITVVTARLSRVLPHSSFLVLRSGSACLCSELQANEAGVRVMRVGCGCGFDKWVYPFLAPLVVRKLKPNLIHGVLETFAGLAIHFCQYLVPSAKRLLTLQTTNRLFLKGYVLRSPHYVTAISHLLVQMAEERGRKDVMVIPNGIPLDTIRQLQQRVQRVPGRILFVGRLRHMKGVDTLLAVFAAILHSQFPAPNVHLRIVGDGELRLKFEQLARNLGITDRVTFVGYIPVPQVYEEFAQAEIFCGLSRHEALGNAFLEAQAAGCAVIGTNIEGIPEIVTDGKTGLLVPPDDVHAARGALGRLLKDASFRKQLAEAGKKNAERYDWETVAGEYERTYQMLLAPASGQ